MNFLMKLISNNKKLLFSLALIFPIIINLIIFFLIESNKVILVIVFINIYYLILIYFYFVIKKINKSRLPRSPIQFIKQFNITGNKLYWDEFKKPLRHLTGVEVGVLGGEHALKIYNYLNIKNLYLVDPFKEYKDYIHGKINTNWDQKKHDEDYLNVKKKFSKFNNVEIMRMTSFEASKKFEDDSLDFVYLDGDHSYEAVKLDLQSWYPKLKEFGVMCGDDYGHISGRGVVKAVNEFAFDKKVVVIYGNDNQFSFVKTSS